MVDAARLREELKRARELIASRPDIRARFDKDGNGVIDGDEWEEVRQLVIRRLEREEAEQAEAVRMGAAAQAPPDHTPDVGAVAARIVNADLPARSAATAPPTSAVSSDQLVLKSEGLGHALMGEMFRRKFALLHPSGQLLATVEQRENQVLQAFSQRGFQIPDLHFSVADGVCGQFLTFRRQASLAHDRMDVLDDSGNVVAWASWQFSLLSKKFRVQSSFEDIWLTVANALWRPFTYQVLDVVDDPVGEMAVGWSGLGGLLTGGNLVHIQVDAGRASAPMKWALVAAAVLSDVIHERHGDP